MEFDIFFSICQTEVHGYLPDERTMFANFFEQIELADRLGFGTAWVAESHLSTEVQKTNPGAVIPHFVGEIGLNTDILQLAHNYGHLETVLNKSLSTDLDTVQFILKLIKGAYLRPE